MRNNTIVYFTLSLTLSAIPAVAAAQDAAPPRRAVFEAAAIKPSVLDDKPSAFRVRGSQFSTHNTTLAELIAFAYVLHSSQLMPTHPWITETRFDITAGTAGAGPPNQRQLREALQTLLAERFKLTFHYAQRDLSAYVITVGRRGVKFTPSNSLAGTEPGLSLRMSGSLRARNATMGDFARTLQQGEVFDRPVVDRTGLSGRYDFALTWTPDDSQFGGHAIKELLENGAQPPPELFTAFDEQLGLRIEATRLPVEMMSIDSADKPTDN